MWRPVSSNTLLGGTLPGRTDPQLVEDKGVVDLSVRPGNVLKATVLFAPVTVSSIRKGANTVTLMPAIGISGHTRNHEADSVDPDEATIPAGERFPGIDYRITRLERDKLRIDAARTVARGDERECTQKSGNEDSRFRSATHGVPPKGWPLSCGHA